MFLKETIIDCQKAGYYQGDDPDIVAFSCWSMIHGIINLSLRKQVNFIDTDTKNLADSVLEMMTNMAHAAKNSKP